MEYDWCERIYCTSKRPGYVIIQREWNIYLYEQYAE